jgi:hypothetical protein
MVVRVNWNNTLANNLTFLHSRTKKWITNVRKYKAPSL